MSLNYGTGNSVRALIPIVNGDCTFKAINHNLQQQTAGDSYHASPYLPISHIDTESVIHIGNHCFKKAIPEDANGVIEYFVTVFNSVDGSASHTKVAEYVPVLSKGTKYSYAVDAKFRVGDYITQSEIESSSAFMFSVKRKADNGKPSIGFGGNVMTYIIMSPISLVL